MASGRGGRGEDSVLIKGQATEFDHAPVSIQMTQAGLVSFLFLFSSLLFSYVEGDYKRREAEIERLGSACDWAARCKIPRESITMFVGKNKLNVFDWKYLGVAGFFNWEGVLIVNYL